MTSKKFKTLHGYIQSSTPVLEGKKLHNYASLDLQVDSDSTERVVFFFPKPSKSSHAFNHVLQYTGKDIAVSITGLIQNDDGDYLASKTTTVRPKTVPFEQMQIENDFKLIGDLDYTMENNENLNISGTVVHVNDPVLVEKFDQSTQKRIGIKEQSFIVADTTGSVHVFVWDDLVEKMETGKSYQFLNIKTCLDANNQGYVQSTFKSEIKPCGKIDFNEDLVEFTKTIIIKREKQVTGKVSSSKTSVWISCPKCKTRSDSNELIITCTKCNSSFRSKNQSLKVEIIVEDKHDKQHCLSIYKDELLTYIPNPDANRVNLFFLTDEIFEFTVNCRTLNVIDIKKFNDLKKPKQAHEKKNIDK